MSDVKFTKDHEWIRLDGDVAVVGITQYAQEALGDVVYVEVPEAGKAVEQGGEEVVEGNAALEDDPALVNSAPTGDGWIFKIRLSNPAELESLMTEADYHAYTEGLD